MTHITAAEYIPLAWQLPVVLGVAPDTVPGGDILPYKVRIQVVKVFHGLAALREALWLREHTESAIELLQQRVVSVMTLMKATFLKQSLVDFRFVKFHMTLHLTECIERFGSLRYTDSGPGERQHKRLVKPAFRKTSKKKRQVAGELAIAVNTVHTISIMCMRHNITIHDAKPSVPCVARDGFSGQCCTLTELKYTRTISEAVNLPGTGEELCEHFKLGLVAMLLLETGQCSYRDATRQPYNSERGRCLRKIFFNLFHPPVLYKSFNIRVGDSSTTFRASRRFHERPWYDFLCCSVDEGDRGVNKYAARALTFVSLTKKGLHAQSQMLVLVEWYVSAVGGGGGKQKRKRGGEETRDLRSRHPVLPLPYVKLAPEKERYGLINTEAVNGGLWVQEDFEVPGHFWVIMCDDHDEEEIVGA